MSSAFQTALATSPHDVLDVSTKLSVLSAIQHDLASHHGKAAFVLSVLVSWPTTLHVSWVSGGFAGGAAVVILSDRTAALVLLAGSKYGGNTAGSVTTGGAGGSTNNTTNNSAPLAGSTAAVPSASASMSFRVVAVICATEVIAHNYVAAEHLQACVRTTTNQQPSPLLVNDGSNLARQVAVQPPAAAVAIPRFSSVALAFCTILERARYVMIERSPPAALARMFCHVEVSNPTFSSDNNRSAASGSTTRLAAPLGSITSLAVSLAATVGADDTIIAPVEGSQSAAGGVTVQFPSLSAFRVASLAKVSRSSTVTFANAIRSKRDFSALSTSAAGLETLWCLAGCRSVYYSAEVNVRAAVFREPQALIAANDSEGTTTTTAQSSMQGQKGKPAPASNNSNSLQSSPRGGGAGGAAFYSSPSGVFSPGGVSQTPSGTTTSNNAVVAAPQQLDTKERTIAVTEGAIVLLKKKSAFPPPLWCTAISWNLISRFVLHVKTFHSISGEAAAALEANNTLSLGMGDPSADFSSSSTPQGATTTMTASAAKEPETAPLSVTIFVRTRSTWGVDEFNGTTSATSSVGDVEEVFAVAFAAMPMLVAFVFACRDAFSEFSNGKVLPVLPQGAEFQTLWIPISIRSATPPPLSEASLSSSTRTPSPKKKGSKSSKPVAAPPPPTSTAVANIIAKPNNNTIIPMCMLWPGGSDVDTPRRYPQQLFTISQLSSASSVVANAAMALASLDHLLTETPTAFMMAVQYAFLSNAPRTHAEVSAFEVNGGGPSRSSVVVDALPAVTSENSSSSGAELGKVGPVRWAKASKTLPLQQTDNDDYDDEPRTHVPAEELVGERQEGETTLDEPIAESFEQQSSLLPLITPILSAIASTMVMHFAQMPSVVIPTHSSHNSGTSRSQQVLLPGRLSDLFLSAVTFDTCLRSVALRPSALFPVITSDALGHMTRRFGTSQAPPTIAAVQRGGGGTSAASFPFLVCRWVVATSLRDMFQSLRRWVATAHRRHIANTSGSVPSPKQKAPDATNADEAAAARVRSFSAFPDVSAPSIDEGSMRRLSSAKVSSPLSAKRGGGADLQRHHRRVADLGDWRSAAATVGLDADGVPLNPAEILRIFVHRLTSGAAFNMLQGGGEPSKDHQNIMRDAAVFRDVWRPRILCMLDTIQNTLHPTTTSASSAAGGGASPSSSSGVVDGTVTAARMLTVMLLDVLMDLSIHHHAAVNDFYSGDATTTAFEYSSNILRHGLSSTTVGRGGGGGGGAAYYPQHPVAKQIVDSERAILEWLRKDAPPVAVRSQPSTSSASHADPQQTFSPGSSTSQQQQQQRSGSVTRQPSLGNGNTTAAATGGGSASPNNNVTRRVGAEGVGGDVVTATRSETFSLRSLMQKVQSLDETLLSKVYRFLPPPTSSSSTTSTLGVSSGRGLWEIFVGTHVTFQWSPATTAAGAALDVAPLTRLHRYLSSGVPGSGGTLWHELFRALTSAPTSMDALKHLAHQASLLAMGSHAMGALLLRRDASTQTLRTSAQEVKLLEEHLSLRSHILLSPGGGGHATTSEIGSSPLLSPSHTGGNRSPPPPSSSLNTPTSKNIGSLSAPRDVASSSANVMEDDSDLETNKHLMRRVLKLEHQLLYAHERNAELQRLLASAQQQQSDVAASHAANWDKKLFAHASKAQAELQRERVLFVIEKEAGQREVVVNREAREWFELTSTLLLSIVMEEQQQQQHRRSSSLATGSRKKDVKKGKRNAK